MASPKASGRMIRKSISESEKIASLSPIAAVLFVMLIPHFNAHGKMPGGPGVIKDECVPLLPYLTYENLPDYLQEISDKTNVKWFKCGSKYWLHALKFNTEHQELRTDKMGADTLPNYPQSDIDRSCSGVVPDSPLREEGLKVEGLREEENLKPKTLSSSPLLEEKATEVESQPEQEAETTTEKLSIFEFRTAYHQATGELLPGGLNNQAQALCMRHPKGKLEAAFEQMAVHGGKTFRYLEEVLKGKPKGVLRENLKARGQPTHGEERDRILAANAEACRVFCGEGDDAG